MVYIKIILGLLVWGALFFYGGSSWLESKREQTCLSEVEKDNPDLDVVKERCTQTAELYMKKEEYGSASWFYVLAGDYEKNLNEVEAKITDDFYVNIAHSYMLKGDYEKAREIYTNYPWARGEEFRYVDETLQPDFVVLPKLYADKKENIAKGLAMWNEIYKPIGKIVEARNAYDIAEDEEDNQEQIKYLEEYLKYAKPFKEKLSIDYIGKKKELASLYSIESMEKESIAILKELLSTYEVNASKKYDYIDTHLNIAQKYSYIPDYNSTLVYYKKALALTLDSNDSEDLPQTVDHIYSSIADVYRKMNKNQKSLEYQTKVLKYLEEKDDEDYNSLATVYFEIGEIYYVEKDYNLSIENYKKSIELRKKELKDSEDYYRAYVFTSLDETYKRLANNYTALNMHKKAHDTKRAYLSFLEYEYETHYKLIAAAYDTLAQEEENASKRLKTELTALKFSEKSVETEWGSTRVENNKELYGYMMNVEEYLYACDTNSTENAKKYLNYVESFKDFQDEVFGGEKGNDELLAKSYYFESKAYAKALDANKSKTYALKSVELMKKVIESDEVSDDEDSYIFIFDKYSYNLWDIYNKFSSKTEPLINEYMEYRKKNHKEDSDDMIVAYETVGKFYLHHNSADKAVENYKKALNEASKDADNYQYSIEDNIDRLEELYANREMVPREKSIKLLTELITWEEKNYNKELILSKAFKRLGNAYAENNETQKVVESYNKSIAVIYEYIGEDEENSNKEPLYILRDRFDVLATYYVEHDQKEKALETMQEYMDYLEKTFASERNELANGYNLFAHIYNLLGDKANSSKYKEKSSMLIADPKKSETP